MVILSHSKSPQGNSPRLRHELSQRAFHSFRACEFCNILSFHKCQTSLQWKFITNVTRMTLIAAIHTCEALMRRLKELQCVTLFTGVSHISTLWPEIMWHTSDELRCRPHHKKQKEEISHRHWIMLCVRESHEWKLVSRSVYICFAPVMNTSCDYSLLSVLHTHSHTLSEALRGGSHWNSMMYSHRHGSTPSIPCSGSASL